MVLRSSMDSYGKVDNYVDAEKCDIASEPAGSFSRAARRLKTKLLQHIQKLRPLAGIVLAILAGVFQAFGCLANSSVGSMNVMEASALRNLFATTLLIPCLLVFESRLKTEKGSNWQLVGLAGVIAVKFIAFAVGSRSVPIAEFSLLTGTVPIYTTLVGCCFLKEPCRKKTLAAFVATAGIAVACLPTFFDEKVLPQASPQNEATGYVITVVSALANAVALMWLRCLGSVSALWLSFFSTASTCAIASFGAVLIGGLSWPSIGEVLLLGVAGFFTLMQTFLPALACAMVEPPKVAISMTSAVVLSFIFQATMRPNAPCAWTCVGAVLVIFAMIINSVNWSGTQPADEEKASLLEQETNSVDWNRYGAVVLIGPPESGRLCSSCRLVA